MACTCPQDMYPPPPDAADRSYVFSAKQSYAGARAKKIPCGRCPGCLMDRAKDWGTRIVHEAQFHPSSVFATETYDDEHLPADYGVNVHDHQLFMKTIRNEVGPVRFFACGEYGETTLRPHFHTIIFGLDIPREERVPHGKSASGFAFYRSPWLENLWGRGRVVFQDVTAETGAYVARYTMKKAGQAGLPQSYRRVHPITGVVSDVRPEVLLMSRRPGIGFSWFEKFKSDAFPSDFVVIDGQKRRVPRYYRHMLSDPEQLRVSARRIAAAWSRTEHQTDRRMIVRHEVGVLKAKRLKRELGADE